MYACNSALILKAFGVVGLLEQFADVFILGACVHAQNVLIISSSHLAFALE